MTIDEAEAIAKKSNLLLQKVNVTGHRDSFIEAINDEDLVKRLWIKFSIDTDKQQDSVDIEYTLIQQCREHFRILTSIYPGHYTVEIDNIETYLKFKLIYGHSIKVQWMVWWDNITFAPLDFMINIG